MSKYITIDCGTTNTRISLVYDMKFVDTEKISFGIRLCIDDKNQLYEIIKNGIESLRSRNKFNDCDIRCILASGMITSEFGLVELDHLTTPVGICELNRSCYEMVFNEISEIPIVFIRGVKTKCVSLDDADMMRGEETELIGLTNKICPDSIYILPGSHSKLIKTDVNGKISDFSTMLTGEMISSLSEHTILKDAFSLNDANIVDKYLILGYEYAEKNGINKALFKTRVLKNIFKNSNDEIYSYFLGVVLCDEIKYLMHNFSCNIIIGGKSQIKYAMGKILDVKYKGNVIVISDDIVDTANSIGMISIFEYNSTKPAADYDFINDWRDMSNEKSI